MRLKLGAQIAALAVVVGLLGLLVWKIVNQDQKEARKNGPAPNFTLPRLDNSGELSLASLKGKAVVLNFWASWCAPCRDEVPVLEKAWKKHRSSGLVVVGIDQQDLSGDARRFAKKYGISYPIVRDGPGHVVAKYGLTGVPETFFVSKSGKLVGPHVEGRVSERQLAEGIHAAMTS
jgi:cytochrome c biogenesis protein CcmG, thiol:disulfide interchange protein DsbE